MKKSASSKKHVPVQQNKKPAEPVSNSKLSEEEFILRSIVALRKGKYLGIHTVFSNFNAAFRLQFKNADPVATTQQLAATGKIVIMPSSRGVVLYIKGDEPRLVPHQTAANMALAKILNAKAQK